MIEKMKTVLLAALVAVSLFQSYLIAYSNPKYEPISQNDYVKTEKLDGTQLELTDLLFPEQLVLHFGNGRHSILHPGDLFYPTIVEKVKQRYFEGFRKTNLYAAGINWDDAKNKQLGIEIRFGHGVPFSVLQKQLQFKGDVPSDNEVITGIWIMVKENKEDVRTYFLTDNINTVYEVIKADFTAKDLDDYLNHADFPDYHPSPLGGDYYLPNQPLSMTTYTFGYKEFTAEQLKQSLFVDPGVARNLKEGDGSVIYTDGKRGLQLSGDLHWMNYSDPVAPNDSKFDVRDNLLSAIQFINQHGGWNGKFAFSDASTRMSAGGQTFQFRQYYDRYPIVGQRPESYGSIKLTIQKGTVSNYERSTILIDAKPVANADRLEGGDSLDEKLKAYPKRGSVVTVFPAYRTVVQEKTLELRPVWAVELRDGSTDWLP